MAPALPIHPILRHPITGSPLRAIYVSPKSGRVWWPVLGGSEPPAPPPAPPAPPAPPTPPDQGFPANTPIEQMTAAQQANYWKAQSQKHQGRSESNYALLRQLGITSSDDAAAVKAKLDAHAKASADKATDLERATADAQKAAREAADAEYRPKMVESVFRVAIGESKTAAEIDEFVADLNLARFLKDDGTVDTAKVLSRVKEFTGANGVPGGGKPPAAPPRGPVVPPHGPAGAPPAKAGDSAKAWLARQGIKVD